MWCLFKHRAAPWPGSLTRAVAGEGSVWLRMKRTLLCFRQLQQCALVSGSLHVAECSDVQRDLRRISKRLSGLLWKSRCVCRACTLLVASFACHTAYGPTTTWLCDTLKFVIAAETAMSKCIAAVSTTLSALLPLLLSTAREVSGQPAREPVPAVHPCYKTR